jgi:hypothetical protein
MCNFVFYISVKNNLKQLDYTHLSLSWSDFWLNGYLPTVKTWKSWGPYTKVILGSCKIFVLYNKQGTTGTGLWAGGSALRRGQTV